MKKTDAAAPPAAFNPKAARAALPYMDLPRMVKDGNLPALKAASMLLKDLSKPLDATPANSSKPYQTQLIIIAMENNQRDAFDFLLSNHRTNLNTVSHHLGGFLHFPHPEPGTPLDAAYALRKHGAAGGDYFYAQLIANGARAAVGKHAAAIKADLPKLKAAPAAKGNIHKRIGTVLGRP